MKIHCATVTAACAEVEPFLRAWELTAALQFRPGAFELAYERATIIDRDLTPGTTIRAAVGIAAGFGTATAQAHHVLSKYPDPPAGIARDAAVELMLKTFCLYRENRMKLGDAANFCLTVLEEYSGADKDQRRAAAQRYAVAKKSILNTLATLAAEKGGPDHARKARGLTKPFTAAERAWLEEAIKRLILRAAEVAGNPSATLRQITMTDLPPLCRVPAAAAPLA